MQAVGRSGSDGDTAFRSSQPGEVSSSPVVAGLSVMTANGNFDLTHGAEARRKPIKLRVTLSEPNGSGAPITFDLDDLGTGTATPGADYARLAPNAKISVAAGEKTGELSIDVFNDRIIEPTELIDLQISSSSDPSVVIGDAKVVAKIADNDVAGVTLTGADNLSIEALGGTDTYTIELDTVPTGTVEITATADEAAQISLDGVNFASKQIIRLTGTTPQTISVRAADGLNGDFQARIRHAITGTVIDPNYPDVTVESLYTQSHFNDPSFEGLVNDGILPTGFNSNAGVKGSTINVNNSVIEQGTHGDQSIPLNIQIHTIGHSGLNRDRFNRWTRWYQEDRNTQVFRLFEGEENVRNNRPRAARIESHVRGLQTGVWNDFSARYTIIKPLSMPIFQSFQNETDWSVHIEMETDGGLLLTHRRNVAGTGQLKIPLAENMIGKSFDVRVREKGLNYEVYFNGELRGTGTYAKADGTYQFRWGMYREDKRMTSDALVFVTGATIEEDTSSPVGLLPYRPATTSLSINDATVAISIQAESIQAESIPVRQVPFVNQTIQDGARVRFEQFDQGGPSVAYFDTTKGNRGGKARPNEDVDLFASSVVLSDIADGEWLEFTRDVVPGAYDIDFRAWSSNSINKGIRLLIGGGPDSQTFTELGSVAIPDTGRAWKVYQLENVDLTAWGGEDRLLRIEFDGRSFRLDWAKFSEVSAATFRDATASLETSAGNAQ